MLKAQKEMEILKQTEGKIDLMFSRLKSAISEYDVKYGYSKTIPLRTIHFLENAEISFEHQKFIVRHGHSPTEPSSLGEGGTSEPMGEVKNCPKCKSELELCNPKLVAICEKYTGISTSDFRHYWCENCQQIYIEGDEVSCQEGI